MDESATPSLDSSGNGYSGTWNGNTAAGSGKFGSAASLDGTGDYISMGDTNNMGTSDFTVSGWIKTSDSATGIIMGKFDGNNSNAGWYTYITGNDGKLYTRISDGTNNASVSPAATSSG